MKRRLVIRPEAEADISKAATWYENQERGLGTALIYEIKEAINRALSTPEAFKRLRQKPDVHRVLVRRFPYRVFYITRHDTLTVFAVIHAARHERHWLLRV